MAGEAPALLPVRDPGATLTDLLEVVLNKGVVLHLDLLISVADIPLVGVSVRAALAGMETMIEHGMLKQWDAQTREWVQKSVTRDVPLEPGETVRLRMRASVEEERPYRAWRPGFLYLTDRRLLLFRREPRAVLLDVPLSAIHRVSGELRESIGDGSREVLIVESRLGRHALLAQDARVVREALKALGTFPLEAVKPLAPAMLQARLWFQEPRSIGSVWRPGEAREREEGLEWRSAIEERPGLRLPWREVLSVELEAEHPVVGNVLLVKHTRGEVRLGGDVLPWVSLLSERRRALAEVP